MYQASDGRFYPQQGYHPGQAPSPPRRTGWRRIILVGLAVTVLGGSVIAILTIRTKDQGDAEAKVSETIQRFMSALANEDGIAGCRLLSDNLQAKLAAEATCADGFVEAGKSLATNEEKNCLRTVTVANVALEGNFARVSSKDIRCDDPQLNSEFLSKGGSISLRRVQDRWVVDNFQSPADVPTPPPTPAPTATTATTTAAEVTDDFIPFDDRETGVRLAIPKDWPQFSTKDLDASYRLLLGVPNAKDSLRVRMNASSEDVTQANIAKQKVVIDAIFSSEKINVLLADITKLGGLPALLYEYKFTDVSGEAGYHAHFFVFQGRKMVTLVFEAVPEARFALLAPVFNKIARSIQVTPGEPPAFLGEFAGLKGP